MAALGWIADALRAGGLTVVEYGDWTSCAAPGAFDPKAIMVHHDASAFGPSAGMPEMIAEVGNKTTPPPLAQTWVAYDGVWWVLAGGRCNHAGTGAGCGPIARDQGNRDAIAVETDHTTGELWPAVQLDSLRRGLAAICMYQGWDPTHAVWGHKEYAPDRKVDPDGLDMNHERAEVARIMKGEPTVTCAISSGDRQLWQSANARASTVLDMGANSGRHGDPSPQANLIGQYLQDMNAKLDAIAAQNAQLAEKLDAVLTRGLVGTGQIVFAPATP